MIEPDAAPRAQAGKGSHAIERKPLLVRRASEAEIAEHRCYFDDLLAQVLADAEVTSFTAALPLKILPPFFNSYGGDSNYYGFHTDNAMRQLPDGSGYVRADVSAMRAVPGVVEVNSIGGFEKQFHVTPDPAKLLAYSVTFDDIVSALEKNCQGNNPANTISE